MRASLSLHGTNGVQNLPWILMGSHYTKLPTYTAMACQGNARNANYKKPQLHAWKQLRLLPMFSYYWERAVVTFYIWRALLCTKYHIHFCSISVPYNPLWYGFKYPFPDEAAEMQEVHSWRACGVGGRTASFCTALTGPAPKLTNVLEQREIQRSSKNIF